MSEMNAFFASNAATSEPEEFVVSDRFIQRDEKGKLVLDANEKPVPMKWRIRAVSEEENAEIRASATRKEKAKNGMQVPVTNPADYTGKLAAACVVFPNLNDAELQKSYGVRGADALVRKMLLAGEYANLILKIQEINGFDKDINDLADEVKN